MTLKLGMIGGGPGAFIGEIHRHAMRMDGRFDLLSGTFSRDRERNIQCAEDLGIEPHRVYDRWEHLLETEAGKLDAVAIVTPNDTHFPISEMALRLGLAVLCEKPATLSLEEAVALRRIEEETGGIYALAHTYLAYPMVAEARRRVQASEIGEVRRIDVRYAQGWLSTPVEGAGNSQAAWRTDPKKAGAGGALGDIGTHAFSLLEFVSGLPVTTLTAQVNTFVSGRALDDDAAALLRLENGAAATLVASQICAGEHNALSLSVYGDKGSLFWQQEKPDRLVQRTLGGNEFVLRAGVNNEALGAPTLAQFRTPTGHPEGYIEAFANLYRSFAMKIEGADVDLPGIDEGVRGLAFIEAMLRSSEEERPVDLDQLIREKSS